MKKRSLISLSASLLSLAALSQDPIPTTSSATFHRWQLGANASADYCYRTLLNTGGPEYTVLLAKSQKTQHPKWGYTAGLNISRNFCKYLALEAGVQYSNKGYAYTIDNWRLDPRGGFPSSYYSISLLPGSTEVLYNYHYLDIPVRAIYTVGEKRLRYVASIGITTNIFLKATQTFVLKYENGDTHRDIYPQNFEYPSLGITPTISIGGDYSFSNKFSLRAEPTFRYGLSNILDSSIFSIRLWSAGLNVTCYYALK